MPAPVGEIATLTPVSDITVSLEPVWNNLESLVLISQAEQYSGLNSWIEEVRESMTEDELRTNQLVVIGFYYAILPARRVSSFPAYLKTLEATSPESLRDKMLDAYIRLSKKCDTEEEVLAEANPELDIDSVLASPEAYLEFLYDRFPPEHVDEELEKRAYSFVTNPPAMKQQIVAHLRHMWEKYLAVEWERVTPMLLDCVNAFDSEDFSRMTRSEVAEWITGQSVEEGKWETLFGSTDRVVFIPNAHVGPYIWHFESDKIHYIPFGARLPKGSQIEAPDLSRTEIQVRLSALADDTRLRILRFIA